MRKLSSGVRWSERKRDDCRSKALHTFEECSIRYCEALSEGSTSAGEQRELQGNASGKKEYGTGLLKPKKASSSSSSFAAEREPGSEVKFTVHKILVCRAKCALRRDVPFWSK